MLYDCCCARPCGGQQLQLQHQEILCLAMDRVMALWWYDSAEPFFRGIFHMKAKYSNKRYNDH
jgi:hypothetical protein